MTNKYRHQIIELVMTTTSNFSLDISNLLRTSIDIESLGAAEEPEDAPLPSPDPVPQLIFTVGRNRGEQATYDGYIYSSNGKNSNNGNRYWCCKDNRKFTPKCNARLTTNGNTLVKVSGTHCHDRSAVDVEVQKFLTTIRKATGDETEKPASKIRRLMSETPSSVKIHLPNKDNLRKQLSKQRRHDRAAPASNATCAKDVKFPLPSREDLPGTLFLLADSSTAKGKRVLAITSELNIEALNREHTHLYIDGTFRIAPKFFTQVSGHDFIEVIINFLLAIYLTNYRVRHPLTNSFSHRSG